MAVEVWPYEKNDTAESWREVGPVARVYIGTLGGDDRPPAKAQPNPPPPEPTPEELEATQNNEPAAHTAHRYWPGHSNGRPDTTPGSGDGGHSPE